MPSTVVHVAVAGIVGVALLGAAFDRRSVLLVLGVGAVPDLDVFAGFLVAGGHRSVLHTVWIPVLAAALLYLDTRGRRRVRWLGDASRLRARYGWRGVRAAWVCVAAYLVAGIGLDLFLGGRYGGVNVLYPVHDQFYRFDGRVLYSSERGFVQTFVEFATERTDSGTQTSVDAGQRGSSEEVHISNPVDPTKGEESKDVERIFPIVATGWQLWLVLTSAFLLGARSWEEWRGAPPASDAE